MVNVKLSNGDLVSEDGVWRAEDSTTEQILNDLASVEPHPSVPHLELAMALLGVERSWGATVHDDGPSQPFDPDLV